MIRLHLLIETSEARELLALCANIERTLQMFEDLQAKVASLKTVADSAIALMDGLNSKLAGVIAQLPDQASKDRLQAVSDSIDAEKADLAAALTRNTSADPTA